MTDINDKIGLAELLDRTLRKGVILNADLVVTVADVPLLAANLRLALANVETMLKYGMMEDLLLPAKEKRIQPFHAASPEQPPTARGIQQIPVPQKAFGFLRQQKQTVKHGDCNCCKHQYCGNRKLNLPLRQ